MASTVLSLRVNQSTKDKFLLFRSGSGIENPDEQLNTLLTAYENRNTQQSQEPVNIEQTPEYADLVHRLQEVEAENSRLQTELNSAGIIAKNQILFNIDESEHDIIDYVKDWAENKGSTLTSEQALYIAIRDHHLKR